MNKLNKGITLIALVITIVVLILIAGISISLVLGNGGLIDKAKQSAETYSDEALKEKIQIAAITSSLNSTGKIDKNAFKQELDKSLGASNYTMTTDETTGEITITVQNKTFSVSDNGTLIDNSIQEYNFEKNASFGTDTSNTVWDPSKAANGQAKLDLGETVNLRLKKIAALANGASEESLSNMTIYNSQDNYIRSIEWWTESEEGVQKVNYGQLAMTADSVLGESLDGTTNELIVSDVPVWAWYSNGTIYIWSSDSTINMHPHSERMFQGMKALETIPALSHFVADDVTTARYMFKDTKISNFSICNEWNIANVKTSLKAGKENVPSNNGFYYMCNNTPSNSHPTFSRRTGGWDIEGSFLTSLLVMRDVTVADYGKYVDLGTNILDKTIELEDGTKPAADWRVFKKDSNGGVWLILADYMPNAKFDVSTVGLIAENNSTYNVTTDSERGVLINGLNDSNWSNLINSSDAAGISGVRVKGSFELEEWIESWEDSGYTNLNARSVAMANYNDEWYTTVTWGYYIYKDWESNTTVATDLSTNTDGYANTLYFPHHEGTDDCYGYRLASPSAIGRLDVMTVWERGAVGNSNCKASNIAVRPAVYLPYNVVVSTSGNAWKIMK